MEDVKNRILEKLSTLKSFDKRFALFGAEGHQYQLEPPITEEEVVQIEQENNIHLPADYRFFITNISNRGAGPDYGFYGLTINNRRHLKGSFNHEEILQKGVLKEWNEDREIVLQAYGELLKQHYTDISIVDTHDLFTKIKELNIDLGVGYNSWPEYTIQHLKSEHEVDLYDLTGYVGVVDIGCGHQYILIIKGQYEGHVVFYGNHDEHYSTGLTFIEFYEDWLDKSITTFSRIKDGMLHHSIKDVILRESDEFNNSWGDKMVLSIADIEPFDYHIYTNKNMAKFQDLIDQWKQQV